jgi:hypothetical protein
VKQVYDEAHPRASVGTIPHPATESGQPGPNKPYYPAKAG